MDLNCTMEGPSPGEQEHACRETGILANEDWRADKKSSKKDSMDSGVAGLRDQHLNSNNKSCSGCTDTDSSEIEVSSGKTTYLKGKFLGKGGFAHVHELVDLSTRIVYAGKIIRKNRITKPHHIQKIAREISIHRNLVHKNVVRLHHFFEDNANAYIVLENCSRKSLFHVLKHRYSVTEPEARYYLRQLVEGVKYIHSQKVIHRDLKPGNMLLSEDMVVKLGDFGLATLVDGNKKVSICGTPNYIAPEVLNKLSYSYEADVWAIGCILYAMLVGQPPFETASLRETYSRIVNNKYSIPLTVSEYGRKLIKQLLQPLPENRILVEKINSQDFFKNGYTPDTLSPLCCYTEPAFSTILLNRHTTEGPTPVDMTSGSSAKAALNTASAPKHVTQKNALLAKLPASAAEWRRIAEEFSQEWNFPHCMGALDGKHVVMQAPPNSGSYYYNYKHTHSVVLMVLADAKYRITYADIGANGRISDGGVFKNCSLYSMLTNKTLGLPKPCPLPGRKNDSPYVIVADEAFTLSENVMKPFPSFNQPGPNRIFNYRLSRARRVVENVFGHIAQRFRVLRRTLLIGPAITDEVVTAICVLHNFLAQNNQNYAPSQAFDREDPANHCVIQGEWRREDDIVNTYFPLQRGLCNRSAECQSCERGI